MIAYVHAIQAVAMVGTRDAEWHRCAVQVGQCRSFNFFGWPDKSRIRLSQILVPPNHQTKGVGRALLEAVYRTAVERNALDVTVSAFPGTACPAAWPAYKPFSPSGMLSRQQGIWRRAKENMTLRTLRSCGMHHGPQL